MLTLVRIVLTIIAFSAGGYGIYCQTKAREHISRKKILSLVDLSIIARGPMPTKEILSEEGFKYHRGFVLSVVIFIISATLLAVLATIYGTQI